MLYKYFMNIFQSGKFRHNQIQRHIFIKKYFNIDTLKDYYKNQSKSMPLIEECNPFFSRLAIRYTSVEQIAKLFRSFIRISIANRFNQKSSSRHILLKSLHPI